MRDADLLREILYRSDSGLAGAELFTADEMRQWPQASLIPCLESGLLNPAQPSPTVMCDGCAEGHWEEPELLKSGADADARAYITCPEVGRVPVNLERLRRWRLDILKLGEMVAGCLSIRQPAREVVRSRLWFLGKASLAGQAMSMLLARGLVWPDAKEVIGVRLRRDSYRLPVLLALSEVPAGDVMDGSVICSLSRLVAFTGGRLELEQDALETALTVHASDTGGAGYAFRKEGDYWTIGHRGAEFRLRSSKGLHYLAYLLRSPEQDFHALDLVSLVERGGSPVANDVAGSTTERQLAENRLSVGALGDAGDTPDERALLEYRATLRALQEQLDEAKELGDVDRATDIEEEMQTVARELTRGKGLGGRRREGKSPVERARVNVTKQINMAVRRIRREDEALGQLLSNTIKTGVFCSYRPDSPMNWVF